MSHGLAAMAPSGFLSRLTKCAESQDLRLEPLDVRKATLSTVLARAAPGLRLNEHMMPASSVSRARVEAGGFALQVRPLATLDQEQEPERAVGYAARRIGTCL